jgi:hypothetical protein
VEQEQIVERSAEQMLGVREVFGDHWCDATIHCGHHDRRLLLP